MRIVHVMPWYMPGHAYQENHLCYYQKQLGHDVWVVTSDRPPHKFRSGPGHDYKQGVYEDRGVPIIRLSCFFEIRRRGQVMLCGLTAQVNDLKPNIIHAHGTWTLPTFQVVWSDLPSGCRLFVDDHADGYNIRLDLPDRRLWIWFLRYIVVPFMQRRVSRFLPVNPFAQWHLQHNLGIPQSRIAFLPLGVNADSYYPNPQQRHRIRKKFGVYNDEVIFFTAMSFDRTKGLENLIKAFACVANENLPVRLMVIGGGASLYAQALKQLCNELAVSERVIFTGWVEPKDLPIYFNAGDVAVMPGKISTTKDALGLGVPLIVTSELAPSYLIKNQNGFSFNRGDINSLARRMRYYATDQHLRLEHGLRSGHLANEELAWSRIAERSIALYHET